MLWRQGTSGRWGGVALASTSGWGPLRGSWEETGGREVGPLPTWLKRWQIL